MKVKYHIEGLDCPHCAARLEKMLSEADGIASVKINFLTEQITVESDLAEDALDALVARTAAAFDKNTAVSRM